MPQPAPRLDDDGLVAEILARVPEAGDERRVRSLLAAWWRYAGVRNAAGAVVDSETFIAERGALGLLELPPTVAARVIALEFALLHDPAAVVDAEPAAASPAPEPVTSEPPSLRVVTPPVAAAPPVEVAPPALAEPEPAHAATPVAEQPVAFEELVPVEQLVDEPELAEEEPELAEQPEPVAEEPAVAGTPVADAAPPVAEPLGPEEPVERVIELDEVDEDEELDLNAEPDPHAFEDEDGYEDDDETVPISAFEAFQEERYRSREEAQTAVLAGIVVFFSLVVGLALLLGSRVDHLALPTAADEPLVTGWRAFLAILTGFGGFVIGVVAVARLGDRRDAAFAPTVGLLGLGVLGLGLLSGSVPFLAAGGAVFALGGLVAVLRR